MLTTLILDPPLNPNFQTFLRPFSRAELAFTFATAAAFTTVPPRQQKWLGRGIAGLTKDLSRFTSKTRTVDRLVLLFVALQIFRYSYGPVLRPKLPIFST